MSDHPQVDSQNFLEVYDRLSHRLMAYLIRRVPDVDVASELWAECWALAYEGWGRRRTNPEASEAWVFGIARHQVAAYYRSGSIARRALKRLQWTVPPVDSGLDEELDRIVDREALRADLAQALESLSVDRRRAVCLRIVDGLEYREVAARLGCSEQNARALVSRGLRHMAKALERRTITTLETPTR